MSWGFDFVFRSALISLLLVLFLSAPSVDAAPIQAVAVEGTDRALVRPPAGSRVVEYENSGYRLVERPGGAVEIRVTVTPLLSRQRFDLAPEAAAGGPLGELARRLTAGSSTRYEAVSRILSWVQSNVDYNLDRRLPQDALAVLERRTAYCTGTARLTVELLTALAIEAREVPGFVVGEKDERGAYHRWVEVRYDDRGWVYSDPRHSHHFVPASYVRIASEVVDARPGTDRGTMVERDALLEPVDLYPGASAGIVARRNDQRRLAAALRLDFPTVVDGTATLAGEGRRHRQTVAAGACTFLGLVPGEYDLSVLLADGRRFERRIAIDGREHRALHMMDAATTAASRTGR